VRRAATAPRTATLQFAAVSRAMVSGRSPVACIGASSVPHCNRVACVHCVFHCAAFTGRHEHTHWIATEPKLDSEAVTETRICMRQSPVWLCRRPLFSPILLSGSPTRVGNVSQTNHARVHLHACCIHPCRRVAQGTTGSAAVRRFHRHPPRQSSSHSVLASRCCPLQGRFPRASPCSAPQRCARPHEHPCCVRQRWFTVCTVPQCGFTAVGSSYCWRNKCRCDAGTSSGMRARRSLSRMCAL
jgi:hypothetical protein